MSIKGCTEYGHRSNEMEQGSHSRWLEREMQKSDDSKCSGACCVYCDKRMNGINEVKWF